MTVKCGQLELDLEAAIVAGHLAARRAGAPVGRTRAAAASPAAAAIRAGACTSSSDLDCARARAQLVRTHYLLLQIGHRTLFHTLVVLCVLHVPICISVQTKDEE